MRWLLQWILEDVLRLFGSDTARRARLRQELSRTRSREAYHDELLRAAVLATDILRGRIRDLERAEDTERSELIQAHRDLMILEGDVRHHDARLTGAREELTALYSAMAEEDPDWKMPWTGESQD